MRYIRESSRVSTLWGAALVQQLRLWSGLVLFIYVMLHLANHALGLISLQAMEAGRAWSLLVWYSLLGTLLLYGALIIHIALALWSLCQRFHFRLPRWQLVQTLLGLFIPLLLASHIVGTRLAYEWFNTTASYTRIVLAFWELKPDLGLRQVLLLMIAWVHGCMGIHFWLRIKPWYARYIPILFSLALLWPVLALLGFTQAGREVSTLAQQSGWIQQTLQAANTPDPGEAALLERVRNLLLRGFVASIGLIGVARTLRYIQKTRRKMLRITYLNGKEVLVPAGLTVLEASRLGGIPHASVCGGRGRCSTCRIRVLRGLEFLPSCGTEELRVLKRIGAPPNIRLACQLRPTGDVLVVPLLPASVQASDGLLSSGYLAGQEQEIAVLFADLRGFTRLAEHKLPCDVVFFLNQYFEVIEFRGHHTEFFPLR